jgi:protein-L-isoaspartate(D-aspartate) O-methyltransferase
LAGARGFWVVLVTVAAILWQSSAVRAGPPDYAAERAEMVTRLRKDGIENQRVLAAMRQVPRHQFVAPPDRARAYEEVNIPVGSGQALYAPRVVALAIQMLDPEPAHKVLQVGAGCGYCTAVLCEITQKVYTVDLRRDVLRVAQARLRALGYSSVHWRNDRGCSGWKEHGPFDSILVLCAADTVPEGLVEQLKDGGCMVIPVGTGPEQTLICLHKSGGRLRSEVIMPIRVELMICQPPLP